MFLGYRPPCMCGLEFVEQARDILPKRTAAYRKTTELLHSQLVRKGRMIKWTPSRFIGPVFASKIAIRGPKKNITSFNHPIYGQVYTTEFYDIKSPSKNPYNKDSKDDLGLNQYFVGQSPYEYYKGDPGDDNGIYHDTSQIRGPLRHVSECDIYSAAQLLSGKGLKFPFKMYEKITKKERHQSSSKLTKPVLTPITKEVITGYEVEVIALINHWENKIEDKEKSEAGERIVLKDASTSIYALADGGILVYSSEFGIYEALTFYASGDMIDQPTNLKKFAEQWDKYYALHVKEDTDGWVKIAQIALPVIAIAGFAFAPVIAPALGYASAGLGFVLGAISVALSAVNIGLMAATFHGHESGVASKVIGILSGITGLAGALKNIFSTVGSNVASSGASTLSAPSTASNMGLNQTSSLYLGTGAMHASGVGTSSLYLGSGAMNASGVGASNITSSLYLGTGAMHASGVGAANVTSMTFSELLKAGNMSFSEAIKVSVIGIESSVQSSLWSSTMDALTSSYKVYSNTKDLFKNANDFSDDEIPSNDDKEIKRPVALRFNGSLENMVGYSKEGVDDIGLMDGSVLYLKPSDKGFNSEFISKLNLRAGFENNLGGRVLKMVYVKQLKLYKRAKNGLYNTRISKKRS